MRYHMEPKKSIIYEKEYEGFNPITMIKVYCILDENCVKWIKSDLRTGKCTRHEFSNDKKEKCWDNAMRALNR